MIGSLRVKNVQSHRALTLEFDQPITTIVGASDLGKSAVLRALKWVCLNKPRGEGLLRTGTTQTKAQTVVDGRTVLRERGDRNLYRSNGVEYVAFGNDVPQDIARLFAVSELNFQDQHDAPFWFSLSPGQVAKELNRVVDLELIDNTMTSLTGALREAKRDHEVAATVKQNAESSVEALQGIDAASDSFSTVEQLFVEWQNLAVETVEVSRLLDDAINTKTVGVRVSKSLVEARAVAVLGEGVCSIANDVDKLSTSIAVAEESLQSVFDGDPTVIEHAFAECIKHRDSIGILSSLIVDASHAITLARRCQHEASALTTSLQHETKGRCPVCGSNTKNDPPCCSL